MSTETSAKSSEAFGLLQLQLSGDEDDPSRQTSWYRIAVQRLTDRGQIDTSAPPIEVGPFEASSPTVTKEVPLGRYTVTIEDLDASLRTLSLRTSIFEVEASGTRFVKDISISKASERDDGEPGMIDSGVETTNEMTGGATPAARTSTYRIAFEERPRSPQADFDYTDIVIDVSGQLVREGQLLLTTLAQSLTFASRSTSSCEVQVEIISTPVGGAPHVVVVAVLGKIPARQSETAVIPFAAGPTTIIARARFGPGSKCATENAGGIIESIDKVAARISMLP